MADPCVIYGKEALRLKEYMSLVEKDAIRLALHEADGNIQEAANVLGTNRTTLVEKIARLGLREEHVFTSWERATREAAELRARLRYMDYFLCEKKPENL